MSRILQSVIVLIALGCIASSSATFVPTPVVNATIGPIFGYMNRFDTYTFRGIPYAKPPIGQRRFAPPEEMDPWTTPFNASEFGAGCFQDCHSSGKIAPLVCPAAISEDCLFLNVYTPTLNTSANLPVIVFIHGGVFIWGAGGIPLYDGSLWAKRESLILVTINYRLNIFGGLYTGDDASTGNFNILDQRMALKWTFENIKAFGGDPSRITVSGQSAGATSTGIHYVSPGSWKYFSRAAVISNPYGIIPATKKMAKELGDVILLKLGCIESGAAQLACLRNKTAEELFAVSHTDYLPTPNEVLEDMMQWTPIVDGVIIPMQPIDAVTQGKINPVPLYIGTVANETIPFLDGLGKTDEFELDVALMYVFGVERGLKILELYSPLPPKWQEDTIWAFSKILTDYLFYCPSMYVAQQSSQFNGNRTFTYFFDEHPSWAQWYTHDGPCTHYICHAFDLPSIFNSYYEIPASLNFPHPTEGEVAMSHWVQGKWAEFARNGVITNWPVYRPGQLLTYNISIGVPNTTILEDFRMERCDYFNSIGYDRY